MTTELDKLAHRLYGEGGMGVTNFGFTPGTDPTVTAEERAAEINRMLDRIEAGDYEVMTSAQLDALDE